MIISFLIQKGMSDFFKKLSIKHKNNKVHYYTLNFARLLIPDEIFQMYFNHKISFPGNFSIPYISDRLNYYNKLEGHLNLSESVETLKDFRLKKKNKTYFFDCNEYTRYFKSHLKMDYKFGDVTFIPSEPAIVKSRPLRPDNSNSILLNLDKVRHFTFLNDKKDFREKKNMLVSRNYVAQPHRLKFLQMYIDSPLCNIGMINKAPGYKNLLKERLTIEEQLDYKFILCLEGNDVASNLKWVMSSNSLAVMPVPKYETWFMEGRLIPDFHFVLIKDDYSDLVERMNYFMNNENEALNIIRNAKRYVEQFKNRQQEDLISLLVLDKYFYRTNQKDLTWDLPSDLLFEKEYVTVF
jgi:hypothetical protein